jgi:plastocyanin domain-containing protein
VAGRQSESAGSLSLAFSAYNEAKFAYTAHSNMMKGVQTMTITDAARNALQPILAEQTGKMLRISVEGLG